MLPCSVGKMIGILLLLCALIVAEETGSPAGLMADCPGMYKNTTFSSETLRSLYVVALYPSNEFRGYSEERCKLNRGGALYAAKHLDLANRKTQVLISGYMDSSFSPLVRSLARRYLAVGRNVIVLEIFPILVRTYPLAARTTKPLGHLLGEFMAILTQQGLPPSRLELTGGSLGAYIAAYAAVKFHQLTGKKPARLTGLDPAGPCYRNLPPEERINPSVAEHVDILHTNIDGFGIADAMGHVDFYANGGEFQPSIAGNFILPCFQLCSHIRAGIYWILAFKNPDKFLAVRCDSVANARHGNCYNSTVVTNVLGPKTDFNKPGIYYLPTSASAPYYIAERGLKKRKYDVNDYLLKSAPDEDVII